MPIPLTPVAPIGRFRWRILALLFAATTINYMDRSVLGVLGATLQYRVFQWTDNDYANINIAFKVAYAIGMLSMGALIDKLGTRIGYTLAITVWSIFGMLHAAVRPAFSFVGFCVARFGLGLGEAGNFPAAIKTVAEWFPKKERAFATGIFNAGSNVGAILAPLMIPLVVSSDGTNWQYAFLTTGVFSAIWVVVWLSVYRKPENHPKLSKEEFAYIESDSVVETTEKVPWSRVLPLRETWAFAAVKSVDAVWWFYLFWGGKFLYDKFGLSLKGLALPMILIYVIADFGSIFGGWLSSNLIKKGWSVNKARKISMLCFALVIMPVMFATQLGARFEFNEGFYTKMQTAKVSTVETKTGKKINDEFSPADQTALQPLSGQKFGSAKEFLSAAREKLGSAKTNLFESTLVEAARVDQLYWIAVLLIALAAAGHQAWSANVFTLVSDVFPKKATASVTGFGGMVGAVCGIVSDRLLATVLTSSGPSGYFFAFLFAGLAYLLMLGIAHVLMPNLTPLDQNLRRVSRRSAGQI